MAVGSGLAAQCGVAPETTFGTYAAPLRFYEFNSEGLKKVKNTVQGGGLAAGRAVQDGNRRVVTTEAASGPLALEVTDTGMGLLLNQVFGGTVTPVQQAATAAYLQSYPLVTDIAGKSATIQIGKPDRAGTVRPYTIKGAKAMSAEFACGVNEILTLSMEWDAQKASEAESIAAPSFAARKPFSFTQMGVKVGTYGAEATVNGVKKMSMKLERGLDVEGFYAGQSGLKAEPVTNDFVKVSGTVEADFLDKTLWADRFAADTPTSIVWEFIGPLIASTYYRTFRLTVPMAFFDGDTPVVEGPGVVSGSFPFVGLFDLTNPAITCTYMSVDNAI